jgi:hypothetical protein
MDLPSTRSRRSKRFVLALQVLTAIYAQRILQIATKDAMSLMSKRKTRVDAKRVAEIIGCSRKTVLNGGAGTSELTRIRNGSRFVRFILEEVEALAEKQERRARSQSLDAAYYSESRGQHPVVTL